MDDLLLDSKWGCFLAIFLSNCTTTYQFTESPLKYCLVSKCKKNSKRFLFFLIEVLSFIYSKKNQFSINFLLDDRIEDQPRVPLPHVVVCNWNQNGNVSHPVPTEDCEGKINYLILFLFSSFNFSFCYLFLYISFHFHLF